MKSRIPDQTPSLPIPEDELKGLLAAVVESSDDAIIGETIAGVVTLWNKGAEKIFGYTATEAIGQDISFIIPAERSREALDILAQVREGRKVEHLETVRVRKDGRHIDINLTASPVYDSAEKPIAVSTIVQDITARKEMERLSGLLTAIIESSDSAIIGELLDGTITAWNKGAERIFGYTIAEAVGQNISIIVPADRRQEEQDILAQVQKGENVERFETMRVKKDGKPIDISFSVLPIRNSAKKIIGVSTMAQDITLRRKIENDLSFYVQELEKSHQSFSEYTAAMVHDLKAPLRHILSYCEFLKEEARDRLDASGMEYVDRLIKSTKRLQRLVDDLLSYARISSPGEAPQELDLNKAVQEVVEDSDFIIKESEAIINVGKLPVISVHPPYIKQLFRNLISNAIKYRSSRNPVITIDCADKETHYLFSVRDNGMGIQKEHLETIFKPFKRLHAHEAIEGSGLGLFICTRIIELYKGKIWAESVPGEGSVFFFTIPKVTSDR